MATTIWLPSGKEEEMGATKGEIMVLSGIPKQSRVPMKFQMLTVSKELLACT